MKVCISANNGAELIILPFITNEPEISQEQKNEDFNNIKLIGELGLRSLTIEAFLPSREMPSMAKGSVADPHFYINWINRLRNSKIPLRLIMTKNDNTEHLNMPILINNFTHNTNRIGDANITLEVEEFRFRMVRRV